MRVLFLADAVFEDLPGGSRTAAQALARGLAARGNSVTFLVGRQNDLAPADEVQGGVRIVRYAGAGQGFGFVQAGQKAAARLWAKMPFDLVHTHFAYAALGPGRVIPEHIPRVRTFHGPWEEEGWIEETQSDPRTIGRAKAWLKREIRRRIETHDLRQSDAVITLSDCFRTLAIEHGISPERVSVISGGTDTTRFVPVLDKIAARCVLGLPPHRKILLSVRRLAPRMGLSSLVAALPAILTRHPDALLLMGGTGPEAPQLAAQIKRLGLDCHARLLGFVPDAQLPSLYGAADLFVLPTLALEGFGLVTTEALACGTPVVGTPVGATPEILAALDSRLIAPDATPAGLAAAILRFFEGQTPGGWAARLTPQHLTAFVESRYTWECHVTATEAIYHSFTREGKV